MRDLEQWTPERALLGALARYTTLAGLPHARITVTVEPDRGWGSALSQLGLREGDLLNVTITIPWGRPDPRGPGKESTLIRWDERGNMVRDRPPCVLQSLVRRQDASRPTAIDKFAIAARARLDRELARGYADIRGLADLSRPTDTIRERPMLPARTTAGIRLGNGITAYRLLQHDQPWGALYEATVEPPPPVFIDVTLTPQSEHTFD